MGKHILSLNFPDTTNEGVFLIDDISIYDQTLLDATASPTTSTTVTTTTDVTTNPRTEETTTITTTTTEIDTSTPCNGYIIPCANIQVTSPGFVSPTVISTKYTNFRLVLNACSLGITNNNSNCAEGCPNIPDGLYNIRYSVIPNDKVYVEYKILRIVQALNRYYNLLCKIGLTTCLPNAELQYQLNSLETIYQYLIAAKVMVENEHQFTNGMNLYRFAISLMNKMSLEPMPC